MNTEYIATETSNLINDFIHQIRNNYYYILKNNRIHEDSMTYWHLKKSGTLVNGAITSSKSYLGNT